MSYNFTYTGAPVTSQTSLGYINGTYNNSGSLSVSTNNNNNNLTTYNLGSITLPTTGIFIVYGFVNATAGNNALFLGLSTTKNQYNTDNTASNIGFFNPNNSANSTIQVVGFFNVTGNSDDTIYLNYQWFGNNTQSCVWGISAIRIA